MNSRTKKIYGTAVIVGGLIGATAALAPLAHADSNANARFLNCLTSNGLIITNVADAVHLGVLIQADEANGIPRSQLLSNLILGWNMTPSQAITEIDCVHQTVDLGEWG